MRQDFPARSSSPRSRFFAASPTNSASPSSSPSEYSRESTPQYFVTPDRSAYPANVGVVSNRSWSLNPTLGQQPSTSSYSSTPPFLADYVGEGIAPHEQVLTLPARSSYPSSSHTHPLSYSMLQVRPPLTAPRDERCMPYLTVLVR